MTTHQLVEHLHERLDKADKRQQEIQILVQEALEYYADPKTYVEEACGYELISPIELDKGEKARKALET